MRPTAHNRVPIVAKVMVTLRDTHISDEIANSQKIAPHTEDAIRAIENPLICLALGVFFFSLINP